MSAETLCAISGPERRYELLADSSAMSPASTSAARTALRSTPIRRPIARIEIVRNDPTTPWLTREFETPVWNPGLLIFDDDSALDAPAFYYARVFQDDGHMAWASPVWVDPV